MTIKVNEHQRGNSMYDVIVIGSGPTGSTAAKLLSENGYSVLMLEKATLPRYKSCSGCLIKKSLELVELYFKANVPDSVTCAPAENKGMVFVNDKGKSFTFPQPGLNVWRSGFDLWLARQAVEAGAELKEQAPVISCEQDTDYVRVRVGGADKGIKNAKYVIDCEGCIGSVKNKLLDHKPRYITTFQTYNEGIVDLDLHYFYAYLQPTLSEYDAWFNVKDNMLVLGVSVRNPANVQEYYCAFIRYMEQEHGLRITKQIRKDRWFLPEIQPGCPIDYGKGRIFFAGEVAGWLNPMGEGISCGMESAFHLTKAIMDYYDQPKRIETAYKENTDSLHQYMIRQWSFTGRMADTFSQMI